MRKRYRHIQLLAALGLLLVANPFLEGLIGLALADVFLLLTLISAVIACATTLRHLIVGLTLAALTQGASLYRTYNEIYVGTAYSLLAMCLFGYVAALVLADVFRSGDRVSTDTICGALAVYLLLGVTWTFAYMALESVSPGSFTGPGLVEASGESAIFAYERFLGYSFVTLTTLGYGNVVPATARADALATLEAVVGQLYLTVLVARLVALNLMAGRGGRDDSSSGSQKTT